ncbi:unnamed protein product [Caenorhabditis bovis]|uniref:Uncharacterized protein n=1 Tax=Caenorhabditis bovis TaxID=2654633 RepID=A0A8S1E937_9PELO|nr:unnamed protein product [Caenorhabditis bovis]
MVDVYQEVVDKLCQIHSDDVEKCAEILEILAIEDAKCGGRVNSAMWRMMKNLIAFDRPFKSYSEKIVLSAEKMPPRPAAPLGQTMDVVPKKRQRIDEEPERLPVDGDIVSQIRRYAWFFTRGDSLKRSAIPVTKNIAITVRHEANNTISIGDSIALTSYQNHEVVVDTSVILIDESLDFVALQSKAVEFCDRDLLLDAVNPIRGMKYLLMGYSVIHGSTSHISFSTGIISSDITPRCRYLGSSRVFKGDRGGSCWDDAGRFIGMQVEAEVVPHTRDNNGRPGSPATGGRCGIIPITCIRTRLLDFLPPQEDVDLNE